MADYVTMPLLMVLAWLIGFLLMAGLIFTLIKFRRERALRLQLQGKLSNLEVGMRTLQVTRSQFDKAVYHQSLTQKEIRISKAMITLEHSLTLSAELALGSLNAHTCAVFFVESGRDASKLVLKTIVSRSPLTLKEVRVTSGEGVIGLVLKEKKAIHHPHLTDHMASVIPYYTKPHPIKGLFVVPIMAEHGLEGVVAIDRVIPDPLSSNDQHLLSLLGRQFAHVLTEARTQGRTEDHAQELLALYEASKALSAPLSLASTVDTILAVAKQTVRCDSALLVLTEDNRLLVKGALDYDTKQIRVGQELSRDGLFQWILKEGKPILFQGRPGAAGLPAYLEQGLKTSAQSFAIMPLSFDGAVSGFLKCDSAQPDFFTEYDREILGILTNQAALALDRAKRFEDERRNATTDALTGLSNRRGFQDRVTEVFELARISPSPITLVICDVDHFKKINDTFGHLQGDAVLKHLGLLLMKTCRADTLIARYGGEEFAILLPASEIDSGRSLAERIRRQVSEELKISADGTTIPVTVSLGVASFPKDAQDSRTLFNAADQALYRAKAEGRNLVR